MNGYTCSCLVGFTGDHCQTSEIECLFSSWIVLRLVKCSNFLQFLEDISPFCATTDTHFFDFWWCLLWASKPEWAALFTLGGGVHVFIPWNSPLVQHLITSRQPVWQPSCSLTCTCEQILVGLETGIYHAATHRQAEALPTELCRLGKVFNALLFTL